MTINIETDRLLLREIRLTDVEGMFALDNDPEVHKYLGNHPVTSRAQVVDIIHYVHKQYEENGIGRWAIIDKASGDFVGWTGLKYETIVHPDDPYYDLGYRLRRPYWGKGIATEAGIASLEYGFTQMNFPTIGAAAHVDNRGSNRVLTKLGFTFLNTFEFDGDEHNWYQLQREDWVNTKQ